MKGMLRFLPLILVSLAIWTASTAGAQDWVHTGTNLSNPVIRLAAADFKPVGGDPQSMALKAVFDATLYNDLGNAGIFDLVSKSLAPQAMPGSPQEFVSSQWSAAPSSAAMVAFGALSANSGKLSVYGWLNDTSNTVNPQVLAKQYNEAATEDMARTVAHRFADEIIARLGGGINGIAETKIYFVSTRSGSKEIWAMDYDGQNQHQVTHLGSISLSPRISPDNSRIAFSSLGRDGWSIRMYSLELGFRMVNFPAGTAWRKQPVASMGRRRHQDCIFVFALGRFGDLDIRRGRWQSAQGDGIAGSECCAGMESAHEHGAGVCERPDKRAADLHDGPGRLKHTTDYRQRVCGLSFVVAERRTPDFQLESQVWAGRSGGAGHLCVRDREHALAAGDARVGEQRLPVVGAGHAAYRDPEDDWAPDADMDDAGRRHASAGIDAHRRQFNAELEPEVSCERETHC